MARRSKEKTLEERAREVRVDRALKKIIPICMAAIAILVVIIYIASVLYNRYGSFTIQVNKYDELQYGLSLSETKDFRQPTSNLSCRASATITNIDGKTLDGVALEEIGGENNGQNYMCYTFYLRNSGTETKPLTFDYIISITNMTLEIEKAVRIRLITKLNDGENQSVDYARIGVDDEGNPKIEDKPYITKPFYKKSTVDEVRVTDFKQGDIMKYTVMIWLEGNDRECVDGIIGGEFKIDMKFNIVA